MSRYSGRYHKGASKDTKAEKRAEAEARLLASIEAGRSKAYFTAEAVS